MAHKIELPVHADERGKLTVIEKVLPFDIKRVFYIYDVRSPRGGHRHKRCQLALIAISGTIGVHCNNGKKTEAFELTSPSQVLVVPPEDWHTMKFSTHAILLVLASHEYDKDDYVYEDYP